MSTLTPEELRVWLTKALGAHAGFHRLWREYLRHGLRDLFADGIPGTTPAEMAAETLLRLCVDDGRFNGFSAPLTPLDSFLRRALSRLRKPYPRDASKRYERLKKLLDADLIDPTAIRDWYSAFCS